MEPQEITPASSAKYKAKKGKKKQKKRNDREEEISDQNRYQFFVSVMKTIHRQDHFVGSFR